MDVAALRVKTQVLNYCVVLRYIFLSQYNTAIVIHVPKIVLSLRRRVLTVEMVLEDVFELEPVRFARSIAAEADLAAPVCFDSAVAPQNVSQGAPEELLYRTRRLVPILSLYWTI